MSTRLRCSFCLRPEAEVRKLVGGAGGSTICDSCASIAVRIMADAAGPSLRTRLRARLAGWLRRHPGGHHLRAEVPAA